MNERAGGKRQKKRNPDANRVAPGRACGWRFGYGLCDDWHVYFKIKTYGGYFERFISTLNIFDESCQ
jgi:hypothetical protein